MSSVKPANVASLVRYGAVELSPVYALLLNAEPPTSHVGDSRLSAGCRWAEPARGAFAVLRVLLLTQLTSTPHPDETSAIVARTQLYLTDKKRIRKFREEIK